jgi:hypothetical protein
VSDELTNTLDLPLALRRARREILANRCFGIHPHELKLIEQHEQEWLAAIQADLAGNNYQPGPLEIVEVPKPFGGIRPGGRLSLKDHVVYTACVGYYSDKIRLLLSWSDRPRDFSHPIEPNPRSSDWLANPFGGWKAFCDKSLESIGQTDGPVVITDIAGFYENIDISLLLSDIRSLDDRPAVANVLSACLNKWSLSHVQGRGVPQGFAASDILARLYLHSVDRGLSERQIFHYRYVDDFRLFSESLPAARAALSGLILLLRKRGLVLQSAKSGIYTADKARQAIAGIQPVLQTVLQGYVDDVATLFGISDPYFTLWDAEQLVAASANAAPVELIHNTYQQYFVAHSAPPFDKTLFHFLLNRLRSVSDAYAYPHCLSFLYTQPQETAEILEYVSTVGMRAHAAPAIVAFLVSEDNVYPYQVYQIFKWRTTAGGRLSKSFIAYIRRVVFGTHTPKYVRSVGRELLARFGSPADIDRLEDSLAEPVADLERAELVCCMRRMEMGRRNSILARLTNESMLTKCAVSLVRAGTLK